MLQGRGWPKPNEDSSAETTDGRRQQDPNDTGYYMSYLPCQHPKADLMKSLAALASQTTERLQGGRTRRPVVSG